MLRAADELVWMSLGAGKTTLLHWLEQQWLTTRSSAVRVDANAVAIDSSSENAPHQWLEQLFARVKASAATAVTLVLLDNVEAIALRRRSRDGIVNESSESAQSQAEL